jgi:hypothetical protein
MSNLFLLNRSLLLNPPRFPVPTGVFVVGRSSGCDLVVRHVSVSRKHAEIQVLGDNVTIVDLESRNGTFIATLRAPGLRVISRDPEHDLCFAIAEAGMADGSIQFWRSTTPSLRYASVHRTAQHRIELGESSP